MIVLLLSFLAAVSGVSSPLALDAAMQGDVLEVRLTGISTTPVLSTRRSYLGAHISVEVRELGTGRAGYLGPRYLMPTPKPEDFSLVTKGEFFGRRFDLRKPDIIRFSTGEEGSFDPGKPYELLVTYRDGESSTALTPSQRRQLHRRFGDFVELKETLHTGPIRLTLPR